MTEATAQTEKPVAEKPSTNGKRRHRTVANTIKRVETIQRIFDEVMKEGSHYGIIPGTKKPTLYKPGSELLLDHFGIVLSDIILDEEKLPGGHIDVTTKITFVDSKTGEVSGTGIGSCATMESKYCYSSKWKADLSEEFLATCAPDPKDPRKVRAPENPFDKRNTVRKMSKKRAQIDGTLTSLGASFLFTQDIEDGHLVGRDSKGSSSSSGDADALPSYLTQVIKHEEEAIVLLDKVTFDKVKTGQRAGNPFARLHLLPGSGVEMRITVFERFEEMLTKIGIEYPSAKIGSMDPIRPPGEYPISVLVDRSSDYPKLLEIAIYNPETKNKEVTVDPNAKDPNADQSSVAEMEKEAARRVAAGESCPPIEPAPKKEKTWRDFPWIEDEIFAELLFQYRRTKGGSFEEAYEALTAKMLEAVHTQIAKEVLDIPPKLAHYRHFPATFAADSIGRFRPAPDAYGGDVPFEVDDAARFIIGVEAGEPIGSNPLE